MSNPVPRFRRRNGNGKNPDGQGVKSGDFFAHFAKKYYSSLDGLNSRNGRRIGIVFRNWVWYNFPQYKPIYRDLKGETLFMKDWFHEHKKQIGWAIILVGVAVAAAINLLW